MSKSNHILLCLRPFSELTFNFQLEAQLETMTSVRAQKDLILLYDEETFKRPTQTIEWLNARGWISSHHHVGSLLLILMIFYLLMI